MDVRAPGLPPGAGVHAALVAVLVLVVAGCAPVWQPAGPMHDDAMRGGPMGGGPMHGGAPVTDPDLGAPPPEAGAAELTVEAGEMYFRPSTIEVPAGEPVNLRLVNVGAAIHDLTVPDLGVQLVADAGEEVVGAIRADEPGRYALLCTVPGHAQAGMEGVLVVG